jgi:hypothetical protein
MSMQSACAAFLSLRSPTEGLVWRGRFILAGDASNETILARGHVDAAVGFSQTRSVLYSAQTL